MSYHTLRSAGQRGWCFVTQLVTFMSQKGFNSVQAPPHRRLPPLPLELNLPS
jgi:hypothetical protein